MDRVQLARWAPSGRRLLLRLGLLAFCGGLLLLLSSRPAEAAERQGLASDLLALVAAAMLAAGALVVRATRPAAAREGGEER